MLYEYRNYVAVEGKLEALNARFRDVTWPIMQRYGYEQVGFWLVQGENRMVYILRWPDAATRGERSEAFKVDKEWVEKRAASEVDGPVVASITSELWEPTQYSELR
jgi:hypothetical protein